MPPRHATRPNCTCNLTAESCGDAIEQKIENRKAQLQKEEKTLNEIKDRVFAGFCKELGIKSIDEYEGGSLAEARQRQEKLNSLSKMVFSPTRHACCRDPCCASPHVQVALSLLMLMTGRPGGNAESEGEAAEEGERNVRGQDSGKGARC